MSNSSKYLWMDWMLGMLSTNIRNQLFHFFVKTEEEQDSADRPSSFTTDWNEILSGEISGYYTVISQGARFYQFYYKSLKEKVTQFSENISAYNDARSGCVWK